jgi:uncharacterized membrane protein
MSWRGSTTVRERIFASLPYLLPLIDGLITSLRFDMSLFRLFPPLQLIFIPLLPFLELYSLPFVSLIIFFALFLLVVRNERISHFIRFNTMQAIMVTIVLFLFQLVLMVLSRASGLEFLLQVFANFVFLGVLAVFVYSVVQSLRGRYAEIPTLSEAVYMQVR